ncbi:MAG: DNA polymerase III subunit beta [Buchnera aphidicola (Nurudea ibofushi)]
MKFEITKKNLLYSLQKIHSLVIKNISYPILENILIEINNGLLYLTATNLELEIQVKTSKISLYESGTTTVSGKKILSICRKLPDDTNITIILKKSKLKIFSKNSHYSLQTLPSINFPNFKKTKHQIKFSITQTALKNIIFFTQFSMAIQDLRYFLNGLHLEIKNRHLYAIATDGYRMAISKTPLEHPYQYHSVILPRKGIIELLKLLDNSSTLASIEINSNYFQICIDNVTFTSKIIDAKFPKYASIITKRFKKKVIINVLLFKQALSRIIILSNELFQGILIKNDKKKLRITTSNQYDEKACEILEIIYINSDIEISINANYMLDILNVIKQNEICLWIDNFNASIQIRYNYCENKCDYKSIYVLMPLQT